MEAHFGAFWREWESKKRNKLDELKQLVKQREFINLDQVEHETIEGLETKQSMFVARVREVCQMQDDFIEGFYSWCKEVTTAIEAIRCEGSLLSEMTRKVIADLKKMRDTIESTHLDEMNTFQSKCDQLKQDITKKISEIYEFQN